MGYAHYLIYRNGVQIEAGYDVEAVCEQPDCTADIDRGLAHLCGGTPGGDEHGCGGYFCAEHLWLSLDDDAPQQCGKCAGVEATDGAVQR